MSKRHRLEGRTFYLAVMRRPSTLANGLTLVLQRHPFLPKFQEHRWVWATTCARVIRPWSILSQTNSAQETTYTLGYCSYILVEQTKHQPCHIPRRPPPKRPHTTDLEKAHMLLLVLRLFSMSSKRRLTQTPNEGDKAKSEDANNPGTRV